MMSIFNIDHLSNIDCYEFDGVTKQLICMCVPSIKQGGMDLKCHLCDANHSASKPLSARANHYESGALCVSAHTRCSK
jgi:hypothetical protein